MSQDGDQLRSAKDYDSEEALRQALTNMRAPLQGFPPGSPEAEQAAAAAAAMNYAAEHPRQSGCTAPTTALDDILDWLLTDYDPATTEPLTLEQELHRLKVLMSYMILDSDREATFDRLTATAAKIFKVPVALVSLADLGRQWFMSAHGLGDVRQTPRNGSFCSHAIQDKNNVFVVPDASEDPRFCKHPMINSDPGIRFYAGAPLISIEGCKLGTFCLIDYKPRPKGLTIPEQKTLMDFAALTVKIMADRRHLADQEDPSRLVACTAHDLLTPLSGVLMSLSMLKEDDDFENQLNEHQKECIATATRSSEMMSRICRTTLETLRKANKGVVVKANNNNNKANNISHSSVPELVSKASDSSSSPCIDIREFVKSLHMIIDPIPKRVPLVITVDSSVPMYIVSDDLKIFRSSLNLLSNACRNTETGSIRFRMYTSEDKLVFECEDSAADIHVDDRERLFHPRATDDFGTVADLGLYSLAAQIDSLGGQYGFQPRGEEQDGTTKLDAKGRKVTGSIFWFSIPIVVPSDMPRPSSSDGITHLSGIRSVESFASGGASVGSANDLSRNNSGLLAVTAAAARSMSGSQNNCLDSLVRQLSTSSGQQLGKNMQPLKGTVNSTWDSKKSNKPMNINIMRIRQALGNAVSSSSDSNLPRTPKRSPNYSASNLANGGGGSKLSLSSAGSASLSTADAPRQKRALVIEDSQVVRKTLARALQKLGYDVSQAVDGMEGLKQLKTTVFDVSLCDFLMPNMDGLDCVQQYRKWESENRPSFRQYIVGISAHAAPNDITKGLEIGMNDFKPKPVTIKTLTELHESTELVQVRATLDELHRVSKSSSSGLSLQAKKQKMDADAILNSATGLSTASLLLQRKRRSRNDIHLRQHNPSAESLLDSKRLKKRAKTGDYLDSSNKSVEKVCLIATAGQGQDSDLSKNMSANGWKVTQVEDGSRLLSLLKTRNWGAVLLDDELPNMSGSRCVAAFREWELKNRVCRQNNVFLVCSSGLPSPHDATSVVQAPCGFDGALDAPVMWKDVKYLLKKSQVGEPQHRGGLNIVTR